jgi:elongation factor 1-alpha
MTEDPKQGKKHLGIVIVGHVDAGKSTTTGRLLFELGGLNERELDKLRKEAQELGKESFVFAFFMDKNKDERARGVTIQCTTKEFFTDSYHYTIIDAPGHRDFIKNMISGASQADVALLMVPANKGGFETSIARGNHKKGEVQGQTRQHARLCHLLGIEQLIVGINKMDDKSVGWSEERFTEIKSEVEKMLTKIGYKVKKIPFIPMSGWKGDNLNKPSENMKWYKGFSVKLKKDEIKGITLIDALERVAKPPKRNTKKHFRMPVSGVYKIKGVGDVITGRIEQGKINADVPVVFYPSNIRGKAFSIEMHHKTVKEAIHGDNVGVNVKGLKKENMPKVGDVMCLDDGSDPAPPKQVSQFTALVFVQDHPGQLKASVKDGKGEYKGGFTPSIHIRTAKAPCQMLEIKWKSGKSTSNQKVENPLFIEAGDQAEVVFAPKMPFCVCAFDDCKPLGRVAAMDSNSLIMLGKVVSVIVREVKKEKVKA